MRETGELGFSICSSATQTLGPDPLGKAKSRAHAKAW
jgi:hypothetical protein